MAQDRTRVYCWVLEFDSGALIKEWEEAGKLHSERIDPQDPPKALGRPTAIRLRPLYDDFMPVAVFIPEGALPIYFVRRRLSVNFPKGQANQVAAEYHVGYQLDKTVHKFVIDATTSDTWEVVEDV